MLNALLRAITLGFILSASGLFAREIHVSKQGNDNNPGNQNQPYLTVSKAANVAVAGDVVIIHEGIYEEQLKPRNSGVSGRLITFKAASGEQVVISALKRISNWQQDQGKIYKASVDWDLGQDNMALFNNKLMDLARWPNNTPQDVFNRDNLAVASGGGRTWLNSNSIPNWNWKNGGSVHYFGGAGFLAWTDAITNNAANRVDFALDKRQDWIARNHHPGVRNRGGVKEFFLQGIKQALDYQNEWYYDKNAKQLFVQLPEGQKPQDGSVSFRRYVNAVELKNFTQVENLAILGGSIVFKGNNSKIYKVSSFYGNHSLGIAPGFDSGRQSVLFTGSNNTVDRCEIAWGSGNGVRDRGNGNKLLNSYVHHFNYIGMYDCPLNTRDAKNGKYIGNTLTQGGRDIIQAYAENAEFAYNDVSHSNLIADDCGLIYTTNGPRNSSIHHNTFHDAKARKGRFKAAGIYLDNDSENWDVHHNVVWNTTWTNIQINWSGTNLKIYNNTFAKGSATMGAWHREGTRFNNVQVWNNITDKASEDQGGNQEQESTWDYQTNRQNNLVDQNSFKNYAANDYTLRNTARAIDFGRIITGYTDGFLGSKPDVGAYEFGQTPFKTGVEWNLNQGPANQCYNIPIAANFCNGSNPNPTPPVSNEKPSISFKTPNNNVNLNVGQNLNVEVNASDANGNVNVRLFLNDNFVRQENVAPYTWGNNDNVLKNLQQGDYSLRAVVTNTAGVTNEATLDFTVGTSTPVPSPTNGNIIVSGTYNIQNKGSGQNVIAPSWDNYNVRMHNAANFRDQKWVFTHLGNNIHTIKNLGTNRYLEVAFAKCEDGSNVNSWTSAGSNHQKWFITRNGNNTFLRPVHCTDKALDKNVNNSDNVHLWSFSTANRNQQFELISVSANKEIDAISNELEVFPNPVSNTLYINDASLLSKSTSFQIFDLSGKVVASGQVLQNEASIAVNNLGSGVYMLQIETGSNSYTNKIVVEN